MGYSQTTLVVPVTPTVITKQHVCLVRRATCFHEHREAKLQELGECMLIPVLGIGLPIGHVGYDLRSYWFGLV